MENTRTMVVKGAAIAGLIAGAYLVLPWFTNSNTYNMILGWIIGILSVMLLIFDGFGGGWKDKTKIGLGIVGVLSAFYLVMNWVPNNNVANMGFGVLLII